MSEALPVVSRACGGRCCRRFLLPMSPQEIRADYARWLAREPTRYREIERIAPMLIYLGAHHRSAQGEKLHGDGPVHHYTCAHHDEVTGLCMIYSTRPEMCSAYPYDRECNYHECSDKPFMRRHAITRPLWRVWRWAAAKAKVLKHDRSIPDGN